MRNPYEVLEIQENATKEEIQKSYRKLAKKYHPDQYGDNPLRDLAEDKMRELNEAYDALMKGSSSGSFSSNSSSNYGSESFNSIRMDIRNNNYSAAENKLNSVSTRNAEWNYLMGIVYSQKGWHDAAYSSISTACSMDPSNFEYRQALNQLGGMNNTYRQPYYGAQGGNSSNICDMCATLYCLDCLCNSMGGGC
jgi:molecular chaperone DnaJ